jgi:putative restriction endonuclease
MGEEEVIISDSLIAQTLSQPYSRLIARLYFFALNLSMPGERLSEEHRNPAEMQNTLMRSHLFVKDGFRAERFEKDQGIQPVIATFGGFASQEALRKWVNNYHYMAEQCEFVRTPDGRLETFPDTWGALALRLFFERYSATNAAPDPTELIYEARRRELNKLIGVPQEWLEVRIAGTAEMFVSDQGDMLLGFQESVPERQAAARGIDPPAPAAAAERRSAVIQQIIRRGENRRFLQTVYGGECQVSGVRLIMPDGSFSVDCAHIRPLGTPHSGKDEVANMLSLSPTMHRLFDRGCVCINPETLAISLLYGNDLPHRPKLVVRGNHLIHKGNLSYHLSKIVK